MTATATPVVGDVVELTVGPVGHGGFCVARLAGQAVFVRHALPGEVVQARVTEARRRYLRADAVDVLESSPDRVSAPCPYAGPGRCGGCDWQHASLPAQRRLKADVVREQLRRLAGLDVPVVVQPVPGDVDGLGWRGRVDFTVRRDGVVGLRRHRSHSVQPVEGCLIAHPAVEAAGVEHRRWPGVLAVSVHGSAASGATTVTVTPRRGRRQRVAGPPTLPVQAAGRSWRVSAESFWQVHPGAADQLATAVRELLHPRPGESAVDLYAGVGLFAGVLGAAVGPSGRVLAVEGDSCAVTDAEHNLADLPWVTVRRAAVSDRLLADVTRPVDVVVLDPPRTGAGVAVSQALAVLRPRAVCYVACDPAALARDVAAFGSVGYRLAALRAYDCFPMTAHVECVALLTPDASARV